MVLFRRTLGEVLRQLRMRRGMTLREVSAGARVSLGYISEIERGQKEASSELLGSQVLHEVSRSVAVKEHQLAPTPLVAPGTKTSPAVVASAA